VGRSRIRCVAAVAGLLAAQVAAGELVRHDFGLVARREVNGQPAGSVPVSLGAAVVDVLTLPPGPEEQVYQYAGPIVAAGTGAGLPLNLRVDVVECRGQFVPVFPFYYENHLRGDWAANWDGREYRSLAALSFRVDTPGLAFASVEVWNIEAVGRLYLNADPQAADVLVVETGSTLTTRPIPGPGVAVALAAVAVPRRRRSGSGC
jgi:hypothetical protein